MGGPPRKDYAIAALMLGSIEILFGLIITICAFVLSGKAQLGTTVTPYWAGIAFIIPGIFGVIAGFTKNQCVMITFMILNIIAFVVEGVGCILLGIVVVVFATYAKSFEENCTYNVFTQACDCTINGQKAAINGVSSCNVLGTISVLMYVIVVFLVLSALVSLAASILGCISVCCTNNQNQPMLVSGGYGMTPQEEPPVYK